MRIAEHGLSTSGIALRVTAPIQAVVILCVVVLVGCNRQAGKESFAYLKAEKEILEQTQSELKKHPTPQPPVAPAPAPSKRKRNTERIVAQKAYHDARERFLSDVILKCEACKRLIGDAQTRVSALGTEAIDPDVVALAQLREQTLGDAVQVYVEWEVLAKCEQDDLRQNRQGEMATVLITSVLDGVGTGIPVVGAAEFLTGVSREMKEVDKEQQAKRSHVVRLQELVAAYERDESQALTKRSQLITSFGAKYPRFPWNSLLPAAAKSSGASAGRP